MLVPCALVPIHQVMLLEAVQPNDDTSSSLTLAYTLRTLALVPHHTR